MRIEINLNGNKYAIEIDGNCFIPIKYGINKSEGANYGKETDAQLGYFNKLSNAALRLCREEIAISDDIVSLKEFASRVEAINKQLTDQLDLIGIS